MEVVKLRPGRPKISRGRFLDTDRTEICIDVIMSTSSISRINSYSPPVKLQFWSRIRRVLQATKKREPRNSTEEEEEEEEEEAPSIAIEMLPRMTVKELLFGISWEDREQAASKIGRMAQEDASTRITFAELGVIPPLVSMLDSHIRHRRRLALHALLPLSHPNFTNKALMVEAGILSKIPTDIDILDEETRSDFAQLLLCITSLADAPHYFPLSTTKVLPFLTRTLESNSTSETKEACVSCLYNLSIVLENSGSLITNRVVDILLSLSSDKEIMEKSLATLGNLVVTLMGKKALEDHPLVPESLIEIMASDEKPKCQELSAYMLMILAHQSSKQRQKMVSSGIVPVLLKVALLGSPLAQKRALKLIQWFKDDRNEKMGPHSGPQTRNVFIGSPVSDRETNEGKRLMKKMVRQSLYNNMEVITQRANATGESSKLKSLIVSSSSKSLPY